MSVHERQRLRKRFIPAILAYMAVGAGAFLFEKVYALFGHGVSSPYMDTLYLYPLAGGMAVYALLALAAPGVRRHRGWRLGSNLYNSGLAALMAGSLLAGIFEIAGTASGYTLWFFLVGAGLLLSGAVAMALPLHTHQSA